MADLTGNTTTQTKVVKFANQLRLIGWVSFWIQLALAIVSTIIFLFAILAAAPKGVVVNGATVVTPPNPGTSGGIFLAICGLVVLYGGIYLAFSYTRIASKLKNPDLRPKKADTMKQMKLALIVNLLGMFLSILAAEAIGGVLLGKSFAFAGAIFNPSSLGQIIQPLDIFLVLGNTHTITAHFVGMVGSLWLISRVANTSGSN